MSRGREPADGGPTEALVGAVVSRLGTLCGFRFGEVQRRSLTMALARRMAALGSSSPEDYLGALGTSTEEFGETAELLGEFTNTETHFFRHAGRFRVLREQVAESLLDRKVRSGEPLRVLSAGCSSGEEVYSTIITMLDAGAGRLSGGLEVVGCDINRRALDHARRGRYGRWSLRFTAPEVVARYFERIDQTPPRFDVRAEVRRHATFRSANLLRGGLRAFEQPRSFDVILCCNVLIYMTEEAIGQILANLRELLAYEGYLLLGYAESLQFAREEFDPVPAGDYLLYRRKRSTAADAVVRRERVAPGPKRAELRRPEPSSPIQSAPAPVLTLAPPAAEPGADDGAAATYARARAEFDADDQRKALDALDRLLATSPHHCGARLLKGYIRGSQGDFLEAATECTKVLDVDPCQAEAYLLRAMLLRQVGDVESALGEAKKALYLEPDLGLGLYLLGQLYTAAGEPERARQAFSQAARTLRERPEVPLAVHVPFELGRDALLYQIDRALGKG